MATAPLLSTMFAQGLAFGAVNSLHCAGMCGPLAAFFLDAPRAAIGYHVARTMSYVGIGAAAGAVGAALGADELAHAGAWVAVVLAIALVLFALGLDKHLARVPGAGRLVHHAVARTRHLPPPIRAATIGVLTPLLPCGLLYAAVSASAVSGSVPGGAAAMLGFALGLLPLLAVTQWNLGWLTARFGRDRLRHLARVAMVVAGASLLWRGVAELTSHDDQPTCPLCVQASE